MRKLVRNLLLNVGVKEIYEAADGIDGLEAIRSIGPDIGHPRLGAAAAQWRRARPHRALARRFFPMPDVPIIMLSSMASAGANRGGAHRRQRVSGQAVSAQALLDRMVSILVKPRPIVPIGKYLRPGAAPALFGPDRKPVAAPAPEGTPVEAKGTPFNIESI